MPRVFISHSSRDNTEAHLLIDWLRGNGFDEVFLDIDKHAGVPPGVEWERKLYSEVSRSTAVVLLLTRNWHESKWCFVEFAQARALGKDIIPVVVAADGEQFIGDSLQKIDLVRNRDEALERLLARLHEIGSRGPDGFSLPAGRPPYPGLLSFDRGDAAIYFGRSDLVGRNLDTLEQLRRRGGERLLLLHGESGSGKSSLLKAGMLPQLERRQSDWISVPVFRPGELLVLELRASLLTVLGSESDTLIDGFIQEPTLDHARVVVEALHRKHGNYQATVLFAIDQLEELVTLATASERERLLPVFKVLLHPGLRTLAVATIRTADLSGMHEVLGLPIRDQLIGPFPLDRLPEIIKRPAQVAGLAVDDTLVAAIVRDARTPDMLPLLAFLLRQLYDRHGGDHRLRLEEYQSLGDARAGLSPLEACVRTAADQAVDRVKPTDAELHALRETFVPGLVRVDDRGQFLRQPLPAERIPAEAGRLIDALIEDRLLIRRGSTVDVAHEALFNVWPFLRELLAEEFEFLRDMTQLGVAVEDWQRSDPASRHQALLTGLRLSRNEKWLARHPGRFDERQRSFIQESMDARDQAVTRRRKALRNTVIASLAAAVIFALLGGVAWRQKTVADSQTRSARQQEALARAAEAKATEQNYRASIAAAGALIGRTESANAKRMLEALPAALRGWEWGHLMANADQSIKVYAGHQNDVQAVDFSADGRRVLSAGFDGTMRIWDFATGKQVLRIDGMSSCMFATFSPDGLRVCGGGMKKIAKVFDAVDGRLISEFTGHSEQVWSASFSPDGRRVVTASVDKTARIWDAKTGREILVLTGHKGAVMSAGYSPDGRKIVTTGDDRTARVWDADSGRELVTLKGHTEWVRHARWSDDGRQIVTGGDDNTVRLWDVETGRETKQFTQMSPVRDVRFALQGKMVVAASANCIYEWSVDDKSLVSFQRGHDGIINSLAVHPNLPIYATCGSDRTLRLWALTSNNSPLVLKLATGPDSLSSDGLRYVTREKGTTAIRVYQTRPQLLVRTLLEKSKELTKVCFTDDAGAVAIAMDSGEIGIWELPEGRALTLKGHSGPVRGLSFNHDGSALLSSCDDGTVRLWDARTGQELRVIKTGGAGRFAVFNPDGTRFLTEGEGNTAQLWDTAGGRLLGTLRGHEDVVVHPVFSPDGRTIATTSPDCTVRLWDSASGACLRTIEAHREVFRANEGAKGSPIMDLGFSHDGKRLLTCSFDNTARSWDVRTGRELVRFIGHTDRVMSASFSPDDSRVVTNGFDLTVRVWDAVTGYQYLVLGTEVVSTAKFDTSGEMLCSGSAGMVSRIWDSVPQSVRVLGSGASQRSEDEIALEQLRQARQELALGDLKRGVAVRNTADVLLAYGRKEEAEALFRSEMDALGDSDGKGPTVWLEYAGWLLASRDYSAAEQVARERLERHRKALGGRDPLVLSFISMLGRILLAQDRFADAEPVLRDALSLCAQELGPENFGTKTSIEALAELLRATDRAEEAAKLATTIPISRDALVYYRRVAGEQPKDQPVPKEPDERTARIEFDTGWAEAELASGSKENAIMAFSKVLAIREAMLTEDRLTNSGIRNVSLLTERVGNLALEIKQPARALSFYQRSLKIHQDLQAVEPEESLNRSNVAALLEKIGNAEKDLGHAGVAMDSYRQSQAVFLKLLVEQPDNPKAAVSAQVGHYKVAQVFLERFDYWSAKAEYLAAEKILADMANRTRDKSAADLANRRRGEAAECEALAGMILNIGLVSKEPEESAYQLYRRCQAWHAYATLELEAVPAEIRARFSGIGRPRVCLDEIEKTRSVIAARPDMKSGLDLYNDACFLNLTLRVLELTDLPGKPARREKLLSSIFRTLNEAVDAGLADREMVMRDPDLSELRQNAEFLAIVGRIKPKAADAAPGAAEGPPR